jgi:hypothetical protein
MSAAVADDLHVEVKALRASLQDLNRVLERRVDAKVTQRVGEVAVPREELTARLRRSSKRVLVIGVVVALFLAAGLVANRVTFLAAQRTAQQQTEAYIQRLVLQCSQPARLTPAQRRFCVDAIPNYEASQRAAAQRAKDYDSLRRWAISRGWEPPPTTAGRR